AKATEVKHSAGNPVFKCADAVWSRCIRILYGRPVRRISLVRLRYVSASLSRCRRSTAGWLPGVAAARGALLRAGSRVRGGYSRRLHAADRVDGRAEVRYGGQQIREPLF